MSGQELLGKAVTNFYAAMFETDPNRKAEFILLANAQVGLHEQKRLQPYIASSIDAPIAEAVKALQAELAHHLSGWWRSLFQRSGDWLFRLLLVKWLKNQWEEVSTRLLMRLILPDGTLCLGVDLPAPPGQPLFPKTLQQIDNEELRRLLANYDVAFRSARGSGAKDWTDLSERMRYILELFRSRQQDARLLEQPFAVSQRQAIVDGHVPEGSL